MTDTQRCPVRVFKWNPFFDIRDERPEWFTRWISDGRFIGAEFRSRRTPGMFAVVHQSTKRPGWWQVSFFDVYGAIGDSERHTADECLREVPPSAWRLSAVKAT